MDEDFSSIHFRKRVALSVEAKVCAGCRRCEIICSLKHEGAIDLERSRIRVNSDLFKGSFILAACRQCSDAPCYYACPVNAIYIDESLGIVLVDQEKCTGCRACVEACPYHAFGFDSGLMKAFKCDFCQGDPECVRWCPVNALAVTRFG